MYDKRTSAELDTILEKIELVVEDPEYVYKNKPGKRGGFVFVRHIMDERFVCVLELTTLEDESVFEIVTAFRAPKEIYFANYEPLWERKDGTPSS
jgi:hypothetical protein